MSVQSPKRGGCCYSVDRSSVARSGTTSVTMNNWIKSPLLVARTRQGEVILHNDAEFQYALRFGSLHRLLTAEQFHLLHNSALSVDVDQAPTQLSQLDSETTPRTAIMLMFFGLLNRSELLELKNLMGKAALMVTTLARAHNSVN